MNMLRIHIEKSLTILVKQTLTFINKFLSSGGRLSEYSNISSQAYLTTDFRPKSIHKELIK